MPKRMSTALSAQHLTVRGLGGTMMITLALGALAGPAGAQTVPAAPPAQTAAPVAGAAMTPVAPPAAPPAAGAAPVAAAPVPSDVPGAQPLDQAALQGALGKDKAGRIEAHITRLHSDLKITAAQEPAWQRFAGTMRANAVQMDGAYARRQQNYAGMNAVQDLQSYGEVEQTNARNIAQLLPPFEALYGQLSAQQQKTADGIFVRHIDRAVKKPT